MRPKLFFVFAAIGAALLFCDVSTTHAGPIRNRRQARKLSKQQMVQPQFVAPQTVCTDATGNQVPCGPGAMAVAPAPAGQRVTNKGAIVGPAPSAQAVPGQTYVLQTVPVKQEARGESTLSEAIEEENAAAAALAESVRNRQLAAIRAAGDAAVRKIELETDKQLESLRRDDEYEAVDSEQRYAESLKSKTPTPSDPGPSPPEE